MVTNERFFKANGDNEGVYGLAVLYNYNFNFKLYY